MQKTTVFTSKCKLAISLCNFKEKLCSFWFSSIHAVTLFRTMNKIYKIPVIIIADRYNEIWNNYLKKSFSIFDLNTKSWMCFYNKRSNNSYRKSPKPIFIPKYSYLDIFLLKILLISVHMKCVLLKWLMLLTIQIPEKDENGKLYNLLSANQFFYFH